MPKNFKKLNFFFLLTVAFSIIATALRFFTMYLSFDFQTKFFTDKIMVTCLYALVLIIIAVIFKASKNIYLLYKEKKDALSFVLDELCLIVFALIFFVKFNESASEALLDKVTWCISIVFSLLSVCYYAVSRIQSNFVRVLNLAPTVFLIAELVHTFVTVSSKANSYYLFPNIIAILVLAFYILIEGKNKIPDISDEVVPLYSFSLITVITLAFSAIPDIAMMITHGFELTKTNVLINALKLIYLVCALKTVINATINEEEK